MSGTGVPTLSVAIVVLNEEERLRPCLESAAWADEIVVVDSESTDGTVTLAREFTDRVWVRPRHALLALKAHRSPLAEQASDHLPVKALVSLSQSSVDDARASSSQPSTAEAWRGDQTRVA